MITNNGTGPLLENRKLFFVTIEGGQTVPRGGNVWSFNIGALPGSVADIMTCLSDADLKMDSNLLPHLKHQLEDLNAWHALAPSDQLDCGGATLSWWRFPSYLQRDRPTSWEWSRETEAVEDWVSDFEKDFLQLVLLAS
jgi:hypothetical protein